MFNKETKVDFSKIQKAWTSPPREQVKIKISIKSTVYCVYKWDYPKFKEMLVNELPTALTVTH